MISSFFKKYKIFKASGRLKKLWQNYNKVAQSGDENIKMQKLLEFLRVLQTVLDSIPPKELQKIFHNFSQLLQMIQEIIQNCEFNNQDDPRQETKQDGNEEVKRRIENRQKQSQMSEYLNSILVTAQKVGKQFNYKKQIKSVPKFLKNIIDLLKKVQSSQTKMHIIRMVNIVAQCSENKQIISQIEGYRKIFDLINDESNDLRKEVIEFLKLMVNVSQVDYNNEENNKVKRISPFSTLFTKLRNGLKKFITQKDSKTATSLNQLDQQFKKGSSGSLIESSGNISDIFQNVIGLNYKDLPPTFQALLDYQRVLNQIWREIPNFNQEQVVANSFCHYEDETNLFQQYKQKQYVSSNTCIELLSYFSSKKNTQQQHHDFIPATAFHNFLDIIKQKDDTNDREQKLDMMKIISKLIIDPFTQQQFKAKGGYSAVNLLFDTYRDYQQESQKKFLNTAFSILQKIIHNSSTKSQTGFIQNIQGFKVLLKIMKDGTNYIVVSKALQTLAKIIFRHPYNPLVLLKYNHGLERLFVSIIRVMIDDDQRRHAFIVGLYPQTSEGEVCLNSVGNMRKIQSQSHNTNPFTLLPLNNQQKKNYFTISDKLLSTIAFIIADSGNISPMKFYSYIVNKAKYFQQQLAVKALISLQRFANQKLERVRQDRIVRGDYQVQQINDIISDLRY